MNRPARLAVAVLLVLMVLVFVPWLEHTGFVWVPFVLAIVLAFVWLRVAASEEGKG
jgi:hypothetical protein